MLDDLRAHSESAATRLVTHNREIPSIIWWMCRQCHQNVGESSHAQAWNRWSVDRRSRGALNGLGMSVSVRASAVALMAVLAQTSTPAQRDWNFYRDPHLLYSNCASMSVFGTLLQEPDGRIDLTAAAVESALEARIRSARVYGNPDDGARQFVVAHVTVYQDAYIVELGLHRRIADAGYAVGGTVRVWADQFIGIHGHDAQRVLGALSQMIDGFVVDYLRANEPACPKDEPPQISN